MQASLPAMRSSYTQIRRIDRPKERIAGRTGNLAPYRFAVAHDGVRIPAVRQQREPGFVP